MHDVAATARFRRMLMAGDLFVRGAVGRVPVDISHEGLSTGGLNFEKGPMVKSYEEKNAVKSSP
eukprot:2625309-Prymnesium_polylepis.1